MKWYDIRFWKWVCIGLVVGIILLAFAGCKTNEYVKVPEYHTEYIVRSDTIAKMDSVYVKDSVYVYQKGDTVVILEVMKMETPVVAEADGTIASIDVAKGDSVEVGTVLATMN